MKDFQENIVPALGQNSANVFLYNNEKSKLKILFAGNSIAKHAPKPSIKWTNDCGMAASSVDHDYVHLIVKRIMEKYDPNVSYGIAQVAQYERNFFEESPAVNYAEARDFGADLILMFFGANVPKTYDVDKNPSKTFGSAYEEMRNYLSRDGEATVYHSMGFYIRPVLNAEKKAVAEKYGEEFIDLKDIQDRTDVRGMYNHPNDFGMQLLADRFFEHMEKDIKRICERT